MIPTPVKKRPIKCANKAKGGKRQKTEEIFIRTEKHSNESAEETGAINYHNEMLCLPSSSRMQSGDVVESGNIISRESLNTEIDCRHDHRITNGQITEEIIIKSEEEY